MNLPRTSGVHFPHKVIVPRRPSYLVPRERLLQLLKTIGERRLVTLSAPAGYGKTLLVTDFATASPPLPVCWYMLDRFDEDPWVFLSYLKASIEERFPAALPATSALLEGRSTNSFTAAANALVREMYAVDQQFILVLDDWHLVDHVREITELIADVL